MNDSCGSPLQREAIRAWIVAHATELPQTLAELSLYPMVFRRTLARALPLEQRVAVWREHLLAVCSAFTSGTPAQRALIADVAEELPALLGGDVARAETSMQTLEPRMRELLTHKQLIEAFASLGPPEPPEGLPLPRGAHPDVSKRDDG
jgi:hypothetical protein